MTNNFLDYSTPVEGPLFIGRKEDLNLLVLRCQNMLGSSIIGIPKIGKTSLAREALRILREDNYVCAEVPLENAHSRAELYKKAIRSCIKALEPPCKIKKFIHKLKFHSDRKKLRNSKLSGDEMYDYFTQFVEYHFPRGDNTKKLVILFDDFDKIRRECFKDAETCMADLRTFSQNHLFAFILTARRTMRMLEKRTDNSTLAGAIHQFDLRPFNKDEFHTLLSLSQKKVPDQTAAEIWKMTSGHPYLVSCMLFCYNNGSEFSRHFFSSYYESLRDMFEELKLYQKFRFLALFGILRMSTIEKEEFEKYGLLIRNEKSWIVFTQDYDDFLQNENLCVPLMETLGKMERRFRIFISQQMAEQCGPNWFDNIPDQCINPDDRREISDRYQRNIKKYPGEQRLNILDFSYFPHLSQLLSFYWSRVFQKILGDDKKKFTRVFDKLIDPRNKEAHALDFLLSPKDQQNYNNLCDELNSYLDAAGIDENGYVVKRIEGQG